MRRADRLFRIVQHLRGGRLVTARQLAERCEVSEWTIYRDIADLIGSGVPIDGAAGLGYLMRSGFDMPPLMFTREEAVALVAGVRMLRAWGGAAMAAAAAEALVKIDAVLPEAERARARAAHVHAIRPYMMEDEDRLLIDRIDDAITGRQRIEFDYTDQQDRRSHRIIRPMGLWFWGRSWTLVGWCELRGAFRMFRVDRIAAPAEAGPFRMEPGRDLAALYASMSAEGTHVSRGAA